MEQLPEVRQKDVYSRSPRPANWYQTPTAEVEQFARGLVRERDSAAAVEHSPRCEMAIARLWTVCRQLQWLLLETSMPASNRIFAAMILVTELAVVCDADANLAASMVADMLQIVGDTGTIDSPKPFAEHIEDDGRSDVTVTYVAHQALERLDLDLNGALKALDSCCNSAGDPNLSADRALEHLRAARLAVLLLGMGEAEGFHKLYSNVENHPHLSKHARAYLFANGSAATPSGLVGYLETQNANNDTGYPNFGY